MDAIVFAVFAGALFVATFAIWATLAPKLDQVTAALFAHRTAAGSRAAHWRQVHLEGDARPEVKL